MADEHKLIVDVAVPRDAIFLLDMDRVLYGGRTLREIMTDWAAEREDVLARFADELRKATGDGSKKRQAGEKPPWYRDDSHEAAMFSHINKWKHGETADPDSGAHPLVHLAWRALAIACRETFNTPGTVDEPIHESIHGDGVGTLVPSDVEVEVI